MSGGCVSALEQLNDVHRVLQRAGRLLGKLVHQPVGSPINRSEAFAVRALELPNSIEGLVRRKPDQEIAVKQLDCLFVVAIHFSRKPSGG